MSIAIVVLIVVIAVFLIIVEIFFIPGTTIFGIIGGVALSVAIYLAYKENSMMFGHGMVGLSVVLLILFFLFGKNMTKSSTFSLGETAIEGKVNVLDKELVKVGDKGTVLTVLKPNGKAKINDKKLEVYSTGSYIDSETEIEVVKIASGKIFVKPQNS